MINGAHAIVYSKHPEKDRAFFKDVLGLPHVDVGHGWLIFALPPAEVAVHPGDENSHHELYLMVSDLELLLAEMAKRGIACAPPRNLGWGVLAQVTLPGGGALGVCEPRHARPAWPGEAKPRRASPKKRGGGKPPKRRAPARPKARAGRGEKRKAPRKR
jgi:hypothetical protein